MHHWLHSRDVQGCLLSLPEYLQPCLLTHKLLADQVAERNALTSPACSAARRWGGGEECQGMGEDKIQLVCWKQGTRKMDVNTKCMHICANQEQFHGMNGSVYHVPGPWSWYRNKTHVTIHGMKPVKPCCVHMHQQRQQQTACVNQPGALPKWHCAIICNSLSIK